MRPATYVKPGTWYAQLPTLYAAAGALITEPAGNVLLVKPNYRTDWAFPGGMLDADETPHDACAREIHEELGLTIPVGNLLVIDWAPRAGDRPRPILYFLFDGGTLHETGHIRLQHDELTEYGFFTPDRASELLAPNVAGRLPAALSARSSAGTVYLPQHVK